MHSVDPQILLGDAIVCWRACVLWQGNRSITGICAVFLLATFGLGLVDTKHACTPEIGGIVTGVRDTGAGFLYAGFSYGIAATALSFCTNLWATALVGYKALVSRRFVRKHVVAGSLGLQTERVLSLLLESGAFYCAIWAFVVARQIGEYAVPDDDLTPTSSWEVCGVVIGGALVPIIAIYPTIIIILVALNRSQIERGFGRREDERGGPSPARMPLRTLTVTIRSAAEVQADVPGAEAREVDNDIADSKPERMRTESESQATATDGPSTEEPKSPQASSSSSASVAV